MTICFFFFFYRFSCQNDKSKRLQAIRQTGTRCIKAKSNQRMKGQRVGGKRDEEGNEEKKKTTKNKWNWQRRKE